MKPKIIKTKEIYKGNVFSVLKAKIQQNNAEYERDIITHGGSAVILPMSGESVFLVKQYRHAAKKFLLELPAGTVDENETPKECATREIEEEIGYKAGKIERLCEFYVSPGFLDEKMHLFLATDLSKSRQNLDEDEILTIEKFTLPDALRKVSSGEIEDAKTIIGLMLAGKRFGVDF